MSPRTPLGVADWSYGPEVVTAPVGFGLAWNRLQNLTVEASNLQEIQQEV